MTDDPHVCYDHLCNGHVHADLYLRTDHVDPTRLGVIAETFYEQHGITINIVNVTAVTCGERYWKVSWV